MQKHWDTNLLGVEYDPEDWLTKLRAGTPERDLLVRRVHEPESPLRGYIETVLPAT